MATLVSYMLVLGAVAATAAHLAERACHLLAAPSRLVWLLAAYLVIGAGTLAVGSSLTARRGAYATSLDPVHHATGSTGATESGSESGPRGIRRVGISWSDARLPTAALRRLDRPILWACGASSASLLLVLLASLARTAASRRRWHRARVHDTPVLISDEEGPAVVGVVNRAIVLPRWVFALSPEERDLVVCHEREHLRGGDPQMQALMMIALILVPWNIPLWYVRSRLRRAIEVDCDRRVLRRRPNIRIYGELLLNAASRMLVTRPLALRFAGVSDLRVRLERMTAVEPRYLVPRAIMWGASCATLVAVGCATPRPRIDVASEARAPRPMGSAERGAMDGVVRSAAPQPAPIRIAKATPPDEVGQTPFRAKQKGRPILGVGGEALQPGSFSDKGSTAVVEPVSSDGAPLEVPQVVRVTVRDGRVAVAHEVARRDPRAAPRLFSVSVARQSSMGPTGAMVYHPVVTPEAPSK